MKYAAQKAFFNDRACVKYRVCVFVVSFWLFSPAAGFDMVESHPLAEKAATMR